MDNDIAIMANPAALPTQCNFVVDRPVADGSYYFGNPEQAKQSPLAERLFNIPGIFGVLMSDKEITVTKAGPDEWPVLGRQVGAAIREHITSGEDCVTEDYRSSIPSEDEIREKVEAVLETEINPSIESHGGVVSLLGVEKNSVILKMGGGCQGCASASATLKNGVEVAIRRAVPGVGQILDQTDHAAGKNPYYAQA